MRSKAVSAYSLLFFLSGATGLIYQLLWVRVLYQSFGSTIQSITTVVAAYMGGLGLGAWLFGRIVDRSRRPAALCGWLEIAIGVFGIASPLVLAIAHRLYIAIAGGAALEPGGGASIALRFGLAGLVLLVPTTLMGGTLPVLTRAFTGDDRASLKPSLGRLAVDAPPRLADSTLAYAAARRPGSPRYQELRAIAALRAGRCKAAAEALIELAAFGIDRDDGPALVRACWTQQDLPRDGREAEAGAGFP